MNYQSLKHSYRSVVTHFWRNIFTDCDIMAKFARPDLRMLIFCKSSPLLMQLQLQQCALHMSSLLVICYTKGYVFLGRCANLEKKIEDGEKHFFLCTIPKRSILGRVPFRAPPPYLFYLSRLASWLDVFEVDIGVLTEVNDRTQKVEQSWAQKNERME